MLNYKLPVRDNEKFQMQHGGTYLGYGVAKTVDSDH